ncbi:hypothetical protein FE257_004351 [Aspergillus nanangensis]|uniref:Uncharacterized protein n=1 Tax=Aspergillus nanangensis TaxID=2582783 RepID=A0AAD4CAR4_ASPNN|nr:hypothetical protein FE257_004351 [Aspergillus nanangensis]
MFNSKLRGCIELWRHRRVSRESESKDSEIWGDWTRPDRPTSVEVRVAQGSEHNSAVDLMPCHLQWAKKEATDDPDRRDILTHVAYEASYLRAENAYYRKIRRAAILFQAKIEAALLTSNSVLQLRSRLEQIQKLTPGEKRTTKGWRQSVLRFVMPRTTILRTAIDDCQVALKQVDTRYQNLQKAEQNFGFVLRRIDQEYTDLFSVRLSRGMPYF